MKWLDNCIEHIQSEQITTNVGVQPPPTLWIWTFYLKQNHPMFKAPVVRQIIVHTVYWVWAHRFPFKISSSRKCVTVHSQANRFSSMRFPVKVHTLDIVWRDFLRGLKCAKNQGRLSNSTYCESNVGRGEATLGRRPETNKVWRHSMKVTFLTRKFRHNEQCVQNPSN